MQTDIITAFVGAQAGRAQLAIAAKLLRLNADNAASIVKVINAAQENINRLANVSTGIGQNVDLSA
ncbi:MAG: hypothetical protein HY056_07755 [Proteobacteria bacterium]|nr:hypothetical protein [Pseudomonadota bacterium]